ANSAMRTTIECSLDVSTSLSACVFDLTSKQAAGLLPQIAVLKSANSPNFAAREGVPSFYKLGAMRRRLIVLLLLFPVWGCARAPEYDLVIRHGTVYDGTGTAGVVQDVAVQRDRIVERGAR